ncbi:hypothetical protein HK099_008633 [Clydaea vesicula]|uniref:N-acetyltransferase domain-containing protein n=1 Tax=Clydaea vesicula TaxID=447962 RepID=A0AAD5TZX7_9FUNG|nr:hypothetical protein HK099_008633 [Clydaea vesicula]
MIRTATFHDVPFIVSNIYNNLVLTSKAIPEIKATTSTAKQQQWFPLDKKRDPRYPLTVFTVNDNIVGFAILEKFHPRSAYSITAELSIFEMQGYPTYQVTESLLKDVIIRAKILDFFSIIGKEKNKHFEFSLLMQKKFLFHHLVHVFDDDDKTLNIYKNHGFEIKGKLTKCLEKLGTPYNVHFLQLIL